MPLLKWIGLVPFVLLLRAFICIMPSFVALEVFHLTNILLVRGIVVSAIVAAMVMAVYPSGVVIVVTPMAIMVVTISLVVLMPISTIVVVVVSSTLMKSRTSTTIMEALVLHRFVILAIMVLPLSVLDYFIFISRVIA
jgi:hypothetical protein